MTTWISRAAALQRQGRVGRTCAGLCFRLYPNRWIDRSDEFDLAEVKRATLPKVLLKVKDLAQPVRQLTPVSASASAGSAAARTADVGAAPTDLDDVVYLLANSVDAPPLSSTFESFGRLVLAGAFTESDDPSGDTISPPPILFSQTY